MSDESTPGESSFRGGGEDGTRTTPPSGLTTGVIGQYKLLQRLGEGGMGEVWLAEQQAPVRRRVALKLVKHGMDTARFVARFETERQALALMNHPGIAKVFDAGATEQGRPYFVMEYIQGEPITRYCDRHRLTTRERLALFLRTCHAVQHAHQKGIIHRDIKASNVLVSIQDEQPVPKIIDFGLAKATAQRLTERTVYTEYGALIGTPEYMSPEQAEMTGLDVDTRTDVYSLGVLLYQLLTGLLPFDPRELRGSGFDEIRRRIREQEPSRPSTRVTTLAGAAATTVPNTHRADLPTLRKQLAGDLDWITMKALEKDRTRRYQSAGELAADVERHLEHRPVVASPPSALYRARKFARRHKVGVAAGALVASALLLGVAGAAVGLVQARRAEARARQEAETAKQVSDFLAGLFRVSDPSEARGNTITAREILDRGGRKIETELADQPLVQANLMTTIGGVYHSLGLFDPAESFLERALDTRRRVLGPEHRSTLRSMDELAALYHNRGRYDEAEAAYRGTLEAQKRVLGKNHPDTLASMSRLASVLRSRGRYAEAETLQRETLEAQKRVLGADHPDTLGSMALLAAVYRSQGRFDESDKLYRETLEARRRMLGADHPDTLGTMNSLANVYWDQGRFDEAEKLHRETLEARRGVLGADHPDTLSSMNNLANALLKQGRYDEAESLYRYVMETGRRLVGEDHPYVLQRTSNLALVYVHLGRYDEAETLLREALERARRTLGDEDRVTLMCMNNLGDVCRRKGRYREARALLDTAHAAFVKILGENHPRVGYSTYNLGCLAAAVGDRTAALDHFRKALELGWADRLILEDEDLDSLRGDPEFESIVAEVVKRISTRAVSIEFTAS